MSYDEACTTSITLRTALMEIRAHRCDHQVTTSDEGLVDKDTGEVFAPYVRGLIRGRDVLSWLGY